MGKSGSKNFVNQFKNTRRLAGRQAAVPLGGRRVSKTSVRQLKKFLPGEGKIDRNTDHGDK